MPGVPGRTIGEGLDDYLATRSLCHYDQEVRLGIRMVLYVYHR